MHQNLRGSKFGWPKMAMRHPTVEKSYDLGQMVLICARCSIRTGPFMRLNTLQLRLAIYVGGVWYDKDRN